MTKPSSSNMKTERTWSEPAVKSPSLLSKVLGVAVMALAALSASAFVMLQKQIEEAPAFAVLNLNKVVQVNETILASKGLKPEELAVEAKIFARRMKTEIENLQKECNCTLLVSSAVISPTKLPDYTGPLLQKLGFTPDKIAKAEILVAERMKALQSDFSKAFK
mgnify:CR=1 FL=1